MTAILGALVRALAPIGKGHVPSGHTGSGRIDPRAARLARLDPARALFLDGHLTRHDRSHQVSPRLRALRDAIDDAREGGGAVLREGYEAAREAIGRH